MKELRTKLDPLVKDTAHLSQAYIMQDDPIQPVTHIALRGDFKHEGPVVEPAPPSFLPPAHAATRLELAKWLMSPDNPLVARVAVNRLWQEMFGRGIVTTSEDFGTQGDKPSHPELLDYLASDFRDHGWSVKRILREIALSSTYRQSSDVRPELEKKDPANTLLARQSRLRLPAELIRDEALAASGLLNNDIGGPSIKPPQTAGVAELGYGRTNSNWAESPAPPRISPRPLRSLPAHHAISVPGQLRRPRFRSRLSPTPRLRYAVAVAQPVE